MIPYIGGLQPEVLRGLIQQNGVTVLHLTAGLFSQSVDSLAPALTSLRFLLVGGGAVDVAALAELWAELLGVARVGRHDHFFELGGHSLMAVQLLSRALEVGLTFSAADLFQAPVLRELASTLHLERRPSSPQTISVLKTGSQPPLFFVPTGLGDCSYVLALVKEMDVDCPVYDLAYRRKGRRFRRTVAVQEVLRSALAQNPCHRPRLMRQSGVSPSGVRLRTRGYICLTVMARLFRSGRRTSTNS